MATHTHQHLHASGQANWDISEEVLNVINDLARPGMVTFETGAGRSTIAFVEAGTHHTAVTPSPTEISAIRSELENRNADSRHLTFIEGYSQNVLPGLVGELDMVLIDGGHGFPIPAVDWTYLAPRLKVGGHILVDDIDLWTGRMLVEFMKTDPAWKLEAVLRGRSAIFRLLTPYQHREWTNQPHVVAQSLWTQRIRKARNLAGMVALGDVGEIRRKVVNERRLARAAWNDY